MFKRSQMHPGLTEVTQEKNKDLGSDFSIAHIKANHITEVCIMNRWV